MILAGTGHRPDKLGGYSSQAQHKLLDFAVGVLAQYEPELVISGMALGWDTALAQAAMSLQIPYHAYIPFVGQELHWPWESRERYRDLLHTADKIVVCSEGEYAVWKMQERNRKMVDSSNSILALWNGSSGGTANCVNYASDKGVEIINVWDEWDAYCRTND